MDPLKKTRRPLCHSVSVRPKSAINLCLLLGAPLRGNHMENQLSVICILLYAARESGQQPRATSNKIEATVNLVISADIQKQGKPKKVGKRRTRKKVLNRDSRL